ncbi:hypothetical protein CXB51_019167 [Gossypium anomalum]|uniref:DUF659 domain-containing protein n=1 Tax=Gossypium anomalum TaxID=47600 RepID=A0A8J5YNR0_9ROSI|nr:hypothetical protein CXB51_019167 [Gossypium anomalum]
MTSQSGSGSAGSSNNVINASVSQDYISNTSLWRYKLNGQGIRVRPKVTLQHLAEMQKIVEDAKLKLQPKIVQLPPIRIQFDLHTSGYNVLRTTLLQKERANIERLLQPIKGMWREKDGAIFLKAVNCEKEDNDKFYVATLIKDVISDVGAQNVVQVITDNAPVCKVARSLTPCVVNTLNLALKNICAVKNTEKNEVTYDVLLVTYDVLFWIINVDTQFASMIVMLKRLKLIRRDFQNMVINRPTLHLVYEMWDEMLEKVKTGIYRHEGKKGEERSIFYEVVYDILIDRWTKSTTPLHCMDHSLNPRGIGVHILFIQSMKRNKINPQRDLNKMWDIRGDEFESFERVGVFQVANLSLDESNMEMVIFANEEEDMEKANAMN